MKRKNQLIKELASPKIDRNLWVCFALAIILPVAITLIASVFVGGLAATIAALVLLVGVLIIVAPSPG